MSHALRAASDEGPRVAGGGLSAQAGDTLDTFLWQADPRTLRFTFVSGQAGRILGGDAGRWIAERQPWRAIAGAGRHRVELALRRAVREEADGEIEFIAIDAERKAFPARLIIRVVRPAGSEVRLWGLMTDASQRHREAPRWSAGVPKPLVAPPIIGRTTRFAALGFAGLFASYALAVSAHRPIPATPPVSVAIQNADRLEEVLYEHVAEEQALESAVGSIEASVVELVSLGGQGSGKLTALEELRAKISELLALTPPELAGRLRALLAKIDRVAPKPAAPPAGEPKPVPPPSGPSTDAAPPDTTGEPDQQSPTPAPTPAPESAPSEAPSAPGMAEL